jgi:hypothetical protein
MAHTFTVTITDEEYRAFSLRVLDPDGWCEHAIRNKVRKNMIWIAEEGAKPGALEESDRQTVETLMIQEGDILKAPKDFSDVVKQEIAKRVKMGTRVERDAAEMAAMEPK